MCNFWRRNPPSGDFLEVPGGEGASCHCFAIYFLSLGREPEIVWMCRAARVVHGDVDMCSMRAQSVI